LVRKTAMETVNVNVKKHLLGTGIVAKMPKKYTGQQVYLRQKYCPEKLL
jgi:putative transposon-encoded protein